MVISLKTYRIAVNIFYFNFRNLLGKYWRQMTQKTFHWKFENEEDWKEWKRVKTSRHWNNISVTWNSITKNILVIIIAPKSCCRKKAIVRSNSAFGFDQSPASNQVRWLHAGRPRRSSSRLVSYPLKHRGSQAWLGLQKLFAVPKTPAGNTLPFSKSSLCHWSYL